MAQRGHPLHLRLADAQCIGITISGDLVSPGEATRAVLSRPPDVTESGQKRWHFFEHYKVRAARHYVGVTIVEEDGSHRFRFYVAVDPRSEHLHDQWPPLEEVIGALTADGIATSLFTQARFVFKVEDGEPIVPLPVERAPKTGGLEIRGLRYAAVDESGETTHSVIFERPLNEDYLLTVSFRRDTSISADSIAGLVNRAIHLSDIYFTRKERRRRERSAPR